MTENHIFNSPAGEDKKHAYQTRLEKRIKAALTPFQEYARSQVAASIFLLLATVVALMWASLPSISQSYFQFIQSPFGFHLSNLIIDYPLQFWVNDILLSLFFFFVGLEIKREFLVGDLTDSKNAAMVIIAAFGGMLVPATLFFIINWNTETQAAWGIPMATDTAFVLGMVSLFKHKLRKGLFTFLAAMAIIDDIGAIIVIAIFYTSNFNPYMLFAALLSCCLLVFINYAGFRRPFPYLILGLLVWIFVEAAGIHGTLSGILVAFLIPARPEKGPRYFINRTRNLINYFERRKGEKPLVLEDPQQHVILEELIVVAEEASTPLQRWEAKLELPTALIILPLFALVNAGVTLNMSSFSDLFSQPLSLGIILGLVIGKPLGILLFSRLATYTQIAQLPGQTRPIDLAAASLLAGIGFTMSIFIASLSFSTAPALLSQAKTAILFASLLAGSLGGLALLCTTLFSKNPS